METGSSVLENTQVVEPTQCDACGVARATWKIVGMSGSILLMCSHHKTVHEAGLSGWATEIVELVSNL